MTLTGIVISAGVMAAISAYMLFKMRELDGDNKDLSIAGSLQALFFFMIIANFILMGSAGYESRNDCDYLMINSTITANTTAYNYDFICTERLTSSASWIYRLPVWLAYFSSLYVVVYLITLVLALFKRFFKGGNHGQ